VISPLSLKTDREILRNTRRGLGQVDASTVQLQGADESVWDSGTGSTMDH